MPRKKGSRATAREKAWQRIYNRARMAGEIHPHITNDDILFEMGAIDDWNEDPERDRIPDDGRHCQRCGDLSSSDPCSVCEYELRKDAIRKIDIPNVS